MDTLSKSNSPHASYSVLQWIGKTEGFLQLLDQTKLPETLTYLDCRTLPQVHDAILRLSVRGAPAIGLAAAYGICLAAQDPLPTSLTQLQKSIHSAADYLATSRPTAVNLFWAINRMKSFIQEQVSAILKTEPTTDYTQQRLLLLEALLTEAKQIHTEDLLMSLSMGRYGAPLMPTTGGVLTHCNAGKLATGGEGTALAVIYAAYQNGKKFRVFADETRPLLQGARLTAWELSQAGIPVTVITDSMAAHVMQKGLVSAVIVGADRIAANGDVANKIGTYALALAASAHNIPFYVAAPSSSFDLSLSSGAQIPIEERSPTEISHDATRQTTPTGVQIYNPAFDITPATLIRAIICEYGVISPVENASLHRMLHNKA